MKRKIAAILAADIAGYSRLVAEDEEETLRRLHDYQTAFKDYIGRAGGRVFKTAGDSVLAEFPSAVDALRCAIDVQESLRSRNLAYPMSRQMAYRVGLTIGDVVDQDGDLLGDGVNIAARLESLAQPGGICISKAMHDAVSSKLSARFIDMGPHQVKNIPIPVHVFSVASEAAGPAAGTQASSSSQRSGWPMPSLAVTAIAVALVSALIANYIPRLFETPKAAPPVVAPVAEKSVPAPEVTPATHNAEVKPAVTESKPAAPEAKTAAVEPASAPAAKSEKQAVDVSGDTEALARLRKLRWAACNADDTASALTACQALVSDSATTGEDLALAHRRLGYAQRKNGDIDAAIASFSESLKLASNGQTYNDRGIANTLKARFDDALADYDEAIRLDTRNGDALNNRAWVYYKTGRTNEALADADKAVTLIGEKAYVWDTRAHILEAMGDRKSAAEDFQKALSIDPGLATSKAGIQRTAGP